MATSLMVNRLRHLIEMDRSSIRLRLAVAACLAISLALMVSGWGLERLFERHVERRAVDLLKTDLQALLSGLKVDDSGRLSLNRRPSNQRYAQPFSGLYWQILQNGQAIEKSRSLWDEQLDLPDDILPAGGYHQHNVSGPRSQALLAVERAVAVRRGTQTFVFRATVALDAKEQSLAVRDFRTDLVIGLSAVGGALLAAFWVALGIGLAPLDRLRHALGQLRSGKASRLSGNYPSEIQPLIGDLNELLEQQEAMVNRAKARAGNLAHGLKTPLTAISVMAEELTGKEQLAIAQELQSHVSTMQRNLEHELALARSVSTQASADHIPLRAFVDRLVSTMRRLPRGDELRWTVDIDSTLSLRIDETALGEIVGNLLDNARKWAESNVLISAASRGDWIWLQISDDGPGIPRREVDSVLQRGRRLDETKSGSGLGLSIASDIVDQIGGRLEFTESVLGGLGVRVELRSRPGPWCNSGSPTVM